MGIGDDCSVEDVGGGRARLLTTDLLVEDVHFLRTRIPPEDLGWKSLAVNLSDIAAMGGEPRAAYLSLAIPADMDVAWLDRFFAGLEDLAARTRTPLLGGDTTSSPGPLVVNIAVTGEMRLGRVKYRSDAEPGDVICVTGCLGDSGAGLRVLLDGLPDTGDEGVLLERHHRPRPHLEEGAWLAARADVRAMMDVSDGIDSDLQRIMERSECGARVDAGSLPISDELRRVGEARGWDTAELAAAAGEDYCLLATVAADAWVGVAAGFAGAFDRPLYRIGEIVPADEGLSYELDGERVGLGRRGFDHFAGDGADDDADEIGDPDGEDGR
jgi:thiamine-monophosphate kinase